MKLTASQKSILLELCLVWCLAIGGARLFYMLRGVPFIRENLLFFTSSLLLYLPAWALWRQKESIDFFERDFFDCLRSLKIFLIFCLILTPLIFGVNHFYQKIVFQAQ
ncbi:MAG: hypothetical protein JNK65_08565, partial [Deltaproteobacteria bacterium]|nr:hypothetical protein [Deltaproteobacteria bacterium]